jgi:hypothetical protein
MNDLLPPLTVHLLDLFQGPLRDIRFPDADGERLGAAVDAAATANEALARAEAALEAARGVLADKQRIVAQETERTLAYARVYAAERPELRAALDAVTIRTPTRRGPGRPRKVTAAASDATESTEESTEVTLATAAE